MKYATIVAKYRKIVHQPCSSPQQSVIYNYNVELDHDGDISENSLDKALKAFMEDKKTEIAKGLECCAIIYQAPSTDSMHKVHKRFQDALDHIEAKNLRRKKNKPT